MSEQIKKSLKMVRGVKVKRAHEHKSRPICGSNLIRVLQIKVSEFRSYLRCHLRGFTHVKVRIL